MNCCAVSESISESLDKIRCAKNPLLVTVPWIVCESAEGPFSEFPSEFDGIEGAVSGHVEQKDNLVQLAKCKKLWCVVTRSVVKKQHNLLSISGLLECAHQSADCEGCEYVSVESLRDKLHGYHSLISQSAQDLDFLIPHATHGSIRPTTRTPLFFFKVGGTDRRLVNTDEKELVKSISDVEKNPGKCSAMLGGEVETATGLVLNWTISETQTFEAVVEGTEAEIDIGWFQSTGITVIFAQRLLKKSGVCFA